MEAVTRLLWSPVLRFIAFSIVSANTLLMPIQIDGETGVKIGRKIGVGVGFSKVSWKIGGRNGFCYDHGVGVM